MKFHVFKFKWRSVSLLSLFLLSLLVLNSCQEEKEDFVDSFSLKVKNATIQNGTTSEGISTVYWGPYILTRESGKSGAFYWFIDKANPDDFQPDFIIHIQNGNGDTKLVSSAIIKFNGNEIFKPSDFSQEVKSLSRQISGITVNSQILEVELRSAPGSCLKIWIEGFLKPKQNVLVEDDFNDLSKWTLWGSNTPVYIQSIFGRSGIFDNMGGTEQNSGAISKDNVDVSLIKSIEADVYLDYSNPEGCCAEASIGIANPTPDYSGLYRPFISLSLESNTQNYPRHVTASFFYRDGATSGKGGGGHIVDSLANKWVTLKIVINPQGYAIFYINKTYINGGWTPIYDQVLEGSLPLWLGARSSGSAGKAYHDNIKVYGK